MAISQAKVKSVLSGDTLILVSVNNPNQERTLSLAFVSAPRLRREGDEVCLHFFQQAAEAYADPNMALSACSLGAHNGLMLQLFFTLPSPKTRG